MASEEIIPTYVPMTTFSEVGQSSVVCALFHLCQLYPVKFSPRTSQVTKRHLKSVFCPIHGPTLRHHQRLFRIIRSLISQVFVESGKDCTARWNKFFPPWPRMGNFATGPFCSEKRFIYQWRRQPILDLAPSPWRNTLLAIKWSVVYTWRAKIF